MFISQSPHRPLHLQIPQSFYFLTAHTIEDQDIFYDDARKRILHNVICHAQKRFNAKIYGYILWPDHYHMIVQLEQVSLHHFVNNIHSYSAKFVNQLDNQIGRRVWYQYWDRFLRVQYSLDDFYRRVSYILHNPVKHGWCGSFEEAVTYPWSSIPLWLQKYGKDGLAECFTKYPVKDWSLG